MSYYSEYEFSPKSQFVTGMLCILLGCFGAHRFYVGKHLSGVIYLLITLAIVPGFMVRFFLGSILLGLMLFLLGTDFFSIYWNMFEDSEGLKISPEGASAEPRKSLLIPTVVLGVISGLLLIVSGFNQSFLGLAIFFLIITFICLFKEIKSI